MKKYLILTLLLISQLANAQLIAHNGVLKDNYNFWVYVPEHDTQTYPSAGNVMTDLPAPIYTFETYLDHLEFSRDSLAAASGKGPSAFSTNGKLPVILFLHGSSLCGNNIERVRRYGVIDAIARGRIAEAVVVAPQNPKGPWNPDKLMRLIEWCEDNYPIDPDRFYVVGISLGGFGTINFTGAYADKVTAAVALCGGGNLYDYGQLNRFPLWIVHGTADNVVNCKRSQMIVDAMKKAGPTDRLRFDLMAGVDHSKLARVFYTKAMYEWLFKHTLADTERKCDRSVIMTKEDMLNGYTGLHGRQPIRTCSFNNSDGTFSEIQNTLYNEGRDGGAPAKAGAAKAEKPKPVYYTVKSGDTLTGIASRNKMSVSELCKLNGISSTAVIKPNQKLLIKGTPAKAASSASYHTVKAGDTLYSIAKRNGTTVSALCKLNNIKEGAVLSLGQKIRVK